ncbi:MAG TPA: hypothetical protein VGF14_06280 [Alphaproteobacteria bacterium]
MTDMLSILADHIKEYLPSLHVHGYALLTAETSYPDKPDYISHRVAYHNALIDRTVYIDLAPRPKEVTLDVFIWSDDDEISSLSISDYIEYEKTGKELPFSCCFALEANIEEDLKNHLEIIEDLFCNALQPVITGAEMFHVPVRDPR